MNKQELIEKIKISRIDDERKQKILSLLEQNDLSLDIKEQIKTLIQEDIEADTSVPFSSADRQEIDSTTDQTVKELSAVENSLNEDMKFVENELNDLEAIVGDLNKVVDQVQIDSVRADIKG
jgi:4-diphosphocytidyl-2C-methyl-D-erythritol kinase